MSWLAGTAAAGAAVVGGVFAGFSVAVMPGLRRVAPEAGTAVMQAINTTILRGPFMVVFPGTALACVAEVVLTPAEPAAWIGAALFVLGSFGVTVGFNVPLNNRLAEVDPDAPGDVWPDYLRRWTAWNHVRTVASIAAAAALLLA
jgi:uncharacterized membrane protein